MISLLYLYPNGYGMVMLVGLMFATIICFIRGFVTYNQVSHNSCNMGIHGLPDITPSGFGCIYQATALAHVTTI